MSEQATAATETITEKWSMPKHGEVCWTEIATNNLEVCKSFYSELFGWKISQSDAIPDSEMQYLEFGAKEGSCKAGGMYRMGAEFGDAPPHWMSYVAVDDVDAAAAKVWELGGKICVPPSDIPNVGRFAVVNDPTGATFSMITLKVPGSDSK